MPTITTLILLSAVKTTRVALRVECNERHIGPAAACHQLGVMVYGFRL